MRKQRQSRIYRYLFPNRGVDLDLLPELRAYRDREQALILKRAEARLFRTKAGFALSIGFFLTVPATGVTVAAVLAKIDPLALIFGLPLFFAVILALRVGFRRSIARLTRPYLVYELPGRCHVCG